MLIEFFVAEIRLAVRLCLKPIVPHDEFGLLFSAVRAACMFIVREIQQTRKQNVVGSRSRIGSRQSQSASAVGSRQSAFAVGSRQAAAAVGSRVAVGSEMGCCPVLLFAY